MPYIDRLGAACILASAGLEDLYTLGGTNYIQRIILQMILFHREITLQHIL